MTDIREIYPEIPTLFLSAVCACVGTHKLDMILQCYQEARQSKDPFERTVVFIDMVEPETR